MAARTFKQTRSERSSAVVDVVHREWNSITNVPMLGISIAMTTLSYIQVYV
ncbi:MAG: hypothetical protein ACYDHP_11110 [Ferrimicrobium sp.]